MYGLSDLKNQCYKQLDTIDLQQLHTTSRTQLNISNDAEAKEGFLLEDCQEALSVATHLLRWVDW